MFHWNGNAIEIGPGTAGNDGVFVTLNGGKPQRVADPDHIHLDLSQMACRIGEACVVMWPTPKPATVGGGGGGGGGGAAKLDTHSTQGMPTYGISTEAEANGLRSDHVGASFGAGSRIGDGATGFPSSAASGNALSGGRWRLDAVGIAADVNEEEASAGQRLLLSVHGNLSLDSEELVRLANAGPAATGGPLAFAWGGHVVEVSGVARGLRQYYHGTV